MACWLVCVRHPYGQPSSQPHQSDNNIYVRLTLGQRRDDSTDVGPTLGWPILLSGQIPHNRANSSPSHMGCVTDLYQIDWKQRRSRPSDRKSRAPGADRPRPQREFARAPLAASNSTDTTAFATAYILPPRTPDIIAHWQVAPPARPPSRWLSHMILTEPCCSFPDIPNMGWHNKKIFWYNINNTNIHA